MGIVACFVKKRHQGSLSRQIKRKRIFIEFGLQHIGHPVEIILDNHLSFLIRSPTLSMVHDACLSDTALTLKVFYIFLQILFFSERKCYFLWIKLNFLYAVP